MKQKLKVTFATRFSDTIGQGSASNLGRGPVFFLATRWRARVWVAAYLDAAIGAPYVTSQQLGLHWAWIGLLKITNDNKSLNLNEPIVNVNEPIGGLLE